MTETTQKDEQVEGRRSAYAVANRAILIYLQSIKEADDSFPEFIEQGGGDLSVPGEHRVSVAREYAANNDLPFNRVRVTSTYMRVDRESIRDLAADLAAEGWEDDDEIPTAYTWQGEGWLYEDCERKSPGSMHFWRCEALAPKGQDGSR